VTRKIVPLLRSGDTFDLVELNERFAEVLQDRFRTTPEWKRAADRSRIHVCPLQEFKTEQPYDFVVSGLPLNNFPADLVREVLESSFQLLAPNGVLTFFEYMYVRPLRGFVSRGDEKMRLKTIEHLLSETFARHRTRRDWIFANLPPAWVQHLQH
jgi:phospholipid N-methyltransferase